LGKRGIESLKRKLGLNTETKTIGFASSTATTNTLGAPLNILSNPIAQGTTDSTREGSTCRVTRLSIRGVVFNGAANLLANTMTRVLIVRFPKLVGSQYVAATAVSSVLFNGGVSGTSELLSQYQNHEDQVYKNTVLFDRTFVFGATGTYPTCQPFEFDWSPGNLHLEWTAADSAGTFSNSIGDMVIMFIMSNTATASNFPVVNWSQKVDYVDN